jgi:hypothetical protein
MRNTFSFRSLHVRQPARDFLCERRVGGSLFSGTIIENIVESQIVKRRMSLDIIDLDPVKLKLKRK